MELTRHLLTFWLLLMTQNEIIIVINTVVLIFHLHQKHEKYWQSSYTHTKRCVWCNDQSEQHRELPASWALIPTSSPKARQLSTALMSAHFNRSYLNVPHAAGFHHPLNLCFGLFRFPKEINQNNTCLWGNGWPQPLLQFIKSLIIFHGQYPTLNYVLPVSNAK